MSEVAPEKSRRGGKRPGAGRKKKDHQAASQVTGVDLAAALAAPVPDAIETAAQEHVRTSVARLVKQMQFGASDAARVNAANAILDRGYGKPSFDAGGLSSQMQLFGLGISASLATEIRDEARKYANLAIAVLNKIGENSVSEAARVSANKSMLDRGLGTVAIARVPDGLVPNKAKPADKPLGKKEEAARAAEDAAAGRYATPAPPRAVTDTLQ